MPRPGAELEKLVAMLEGCLLPRGATIKSPDHITDKITGALREVDVSIRSTLGSTPVVIIIECRDRGRHEDVTWIEQLAQKRNDVNAAKAVAISSSGFSEAAKAKAAFAGIETRRVDEITQEVVKGWFQAGDMTLFLRKCDISSVSIDVDPGDIEGAIEIDGDAAENLRHLDATKKAFICKKDSQPVNLGIIWEHIPNHPELYADVPPDGTRVRRTVALRFSNPDERYQVPTSRGPIDMKQITLVVDLWVEATTVPIDKVYAYKDEESVSMESVDYAFAVDGQQQVVSFVKDQQSGRFFVAIRSRDQGT